VASEIEKAVYGEMAESVSPSGEVGGHCLLEISIAKGIIQLRVAPWEKEHSEFTLATFKNAAICHILEKAAEQDDLLLPWTIRHFYSQDRGNGQWHFLLDCDDTRWSWDSDWPAMERQTLSK
jgi:hypothetical protein